MAADLATLSVRVTNEGVGESTTGLNALAASGARAESAYMSMTAVAKDFARAGANSAQIMQLTGLNAVRAEAAMRSYAGSVAKTAIDVEYLRAAQVQMAAAGMEVAASQEVVAAATNTSGLGLGRLRMGFSSLVASMSGVSPMVARIASTVAVMTSGMVATLGVLAALVVALEVYKAWDEDAAKAKKSQDDLTESLMKWYEEQKKGPAGDFPAQIVAMTAKVKELHAEMDKLIEGKFFTGVEAVGQGGSKVMAWIRIFTSANPAQQFGIEVGKGFAAAAKAATDGGKAVSAATDEATRLIIEDQLKDLKKMQESFLAPIENPVLKSIGKQVDEMRKANTENNAMLRASDQAAQLARVEGYAREFLVIKYKAENEAAEANSSLMGIAREERLKTIETVRAQSLATLVYTTHVKDLADAQKFLNDQMAVVAATGAANVKTTTDQAKAALDLAGGQRQVETMLKETQRSFVTFFDNIFTKGVTSFNSLFSEIKNMFLKLLAEMAAADVMKKIAGPLSAAIGGAMGMPTAAGAQGAGAAAAGASSAVATAGTGAIMALGGFAAGSAIGGMTTNRGLGALGGAAGGAAVGAGIGAMGGPIGVVAGAFIGAAAGAIGGFIGAGNAAKEAAEKLLQMKMASAQIGATLADWRAQITGTAADQKAAAAADLYWKYLSIRQTIEQVEAGKKMEEQRNKDLAEADRLYAQAQKGLTDSTNALTAAMLNGVNGYKYQAALFAAAPFMPAPGSSSTSGTSSSSGSSSGSSDNSRESLTVNVMLPDGTVLAKAVLKANKATAQRQFGDSSKWAQIQ